MRILSIDGGGMRGIIPAVVLAELEDRAGRPAAELFDLVAGTSTGGIIAAALTLAGADGRPRYTAEEIIALYESEGPRIFDRSLLKTVTSIGGLIDERYDAAGLEEVLGRYLGAARLSGALTSLFMTAYEIELRRAFFFRSGRARSDPAEDFRLVDAVRATSAAPTYFEPAAVRDVAGGRAYALIDGGVFAVNPALTAYAEVARAERAEDMTILASLGTGSLTRPLRLEDVRGWGRLEWASPILDVVFDGIADTTDFELQHLLPEQRYVRFQTRLLEASDELDDASAENIAALRREGERLVRERSDDLDALVAAVTGA